MVTSAESCRMREIEGVGNSEIGVCWQTVEDKWSISSTACVEICWRWVHWQRGVGCLSSQDSYLMATKPPWEQNGQPPKVNIMQISHG